MSARGRDLFASDQAHAGAIQMRKRPCERSAGVDGARRILDEICLEARGLRIECRPGDAEVGCQPRAEHPTTTAFPEIACKPGRGLAIRLEEAGIAVDRRVQ